MQQDSEESRDKYFELLEACKKVLRDADGIDSLHGFMGESEDIYAHALADAMGELVQTIYKICPGGWTVIHTLVPRAQRKSQGTKNPTEQRQSALRNQEAAEMYLKWLESEWDAKHE